MGGHAVAAAGGPRPRRLLPAALLVFAAVGRPGSAQDQPPGPVPEGKIVIWAGDRMTLWQEEGQEATLLTGQFSVRRTDFAVSGTRAMVWRHSGSKRPFDELYAEGNVVLRQGNQTMRAERLWVDFSTGRAVIVDLRAQAYSDSLKQAFYLRAREARMLMLGRLEAEDIQISTCSYGVPHYHLDVGKARLTGRKPRAPKSEFDVFPFEEWRFRVEDVYPEFTGMPVFFFPALILGPWVKEFPIRSIQYGRSSRFGHSVTSEFAMKIKKNVEGHKPHTWGEVVLEADWREKRGGATGVDLDYAWKNYQGYIDTYALHDLGRDEDVEFELKFPPLKHKDRGRVRAFHRTDLDPDWRFEVETWYFSDRSLQEEFFEKEFKEDKEPETAAYVRWTDGPWGATVYERHRLNDFQTQNEYMPRLGFRMLQVPPAPSILDTLTLTEHFDAVHIRRRFDEEAHVPSDRTWRIDVATELQCPWDLGPFQAAPFVHQRTTFYDRDLEGEGELRSIWTAGGRLSTQIHGTHPQAAWDLVGLRGLRHVVELEARWAGAVDCTVPPSELFPYEEVDRIDEFQEVSFEMRHRLKTRGADGAAFEFLNAGVEVEYYPDPGRDAVSGRTDNYLPPFNWILLAPDARTGLYPERRVSNLHYDVAFQPADFIRLGAAGEYNPDAHREEVRESFAGVTPLRGLSASVAHTYVLGLTNAYTFAVSWEITEKWKASAAVQYDFRADEYVSQELVVGRDFHDFVMEAVVERDYGRDENRFHVAFVPKFFGRSKPSRASREAPGSRPEANKPW